MFALPKALWRRIAGGRMFATGGGPPDLEELWRDFNRKLSGMFGQRRPAPAGGGGGGGGGGEPPNMKAFGGGLALVMVVVLLLWASSGFFIVPEGQTAAVLRFGKLNSLTDSAGFKWRLPYPIEAHEMVNLQQLRQVEVGYRNNARTKVLKESLMLTDDENIIDIQFAVQYRIKAEKDAARDYLFNNRAPDETVLQAAETAMRELVGRSKMDFVLYEGKEQVAKEAEKLIQQIVDRYGTGIAIVNVTLQNSQPPEQVQAAFDDAVKAGQDRERQKNEGQAYANDVIPKARGTAARLTEEAEAYKQKVIAGAEGEASRFKQVLTEYSKAPQVTRERMYLETVQQVFANTSKVMVDVKAGSQLLYLPLDKLMQAGGTAAAGLAQVEPSTAGAPTRPAALDPAPPTGTDARSREAQRTREREGR
ncbi:MAG: FtsH protease activity modulator HflK [Burkholderiales bacterium]|nr:FtsH protease activity modulator HflK [Burkholderiales bacterium]